MTDTEARDDSALVDALLRVFDALERYRSMPRSFTSHLTAAADALHALDPDGSRTRALLNVAAAIAAIPLPDEPQP